MSMQLLLTLRSIRRPFPRLFASIFSIAFALFSILIRRGSSSSSSSSSSAAAFSFPEPQVSRRQILLSSLVTSSGILASSSAQSPSETFVYSDSGGSWTGTALTFLSIENAVSFAVDGDGCTQVMPMGRWPDPILRRSASPVPKRMFGTKELTVVSAALRKTAQDEGAVGLAAQQIGVDGRILWIDTSNALTYESKKRKTRVKKEGTTHRSYLGEGKAKTKINTAVHAEVSLDEGLFLVNPRIVRRSSEMDMRAWTESCLVLPKTFKATVLRDAQITVQYETIAGETMTVDLEGELARCVQHEMDHDRGILLLDHVDLDELEGTMRKIESDGHTARMIQAYERYIDPYAP